MKNHNNVSKNVLELVKQFPHLKNNYNELVGYYWVMYDHVASVEDYAKATSVESITRNFRRLVKSKKITLETPKRPPVQNRPKGFVLEFGDIL